MKKWVIWVGILILILAAIGFFLSGSLSGPNLAESTPTVPLIYGTNQNVWMFLIAMGLIIAVLGLFARKKKKKKKDEDEAEDEETEQE